MTISTRFEWLALPYPTLGAAAAAAGTTQQCADGQTIVIWDTGTMQAQVWTGGAWTLPISLPAVPAAFSNPRNGRICFLTDRGGGTVQYLWSIALAGGQQFRSFDVSAVDFPTFPANVGSYTLWNMGKLAIFQFPDRPDTAWLCYQDATGKSLMVGWFIPNATAPTDVISFQDSQCSIQLIQQGSQKGNPTLFGDPSALMGLAPGWMYNHNFGSGNIDRVGCRVFGAADGWTPATFPNAIAFPGASFLVFYQHYPGALFQRDTLGDFPLTVSMVALQTGRTVQGGRSFIRFTQGGTLAAVQVSPFDPFAGLFTLPLLATAPAGVGTNWHGFGLDDIAFVLDDAGHFVFLALVMSEFSLVATRNFMTLGTIRKKP